MSDLRHTERGFRWSSCSTEQFKHFLNGETSTCLYNYPHENQLLPRVLPGTMLTLDEQCKRDRGTNACFVSGPDGSSQSVHDACTRRLCVDSIELRIENTLSSLLSSLFRMHFETNPLILSSPRESTERRPSLCPAVLLRFGIRLLCLIPTGSGRFALWRWSGKWPGASFWIPYLNLSQVLETVIAQLARGGRLG